jgi:hypothetical protein
VISQVIQPMLTVRLLACFLGDDDSLNSHPHSQRGPRSSFTPQFRSSRQERLFSFCFPTPRAVAGTVKAKEDGRCRLGGGMRRDGESPPQRNATAAAMLPPSPRHRCRGAGHVIVAGVQATSSCAVVVGQRGRRLRAARWEGCSCANTDLNVCAHNDTL